MNTRPLYKFILLFSLFLCYSCSDGKKKGDEVMISQIVNCAKLNTVQYNVHKLLTYEDLHAIEGSIFSEKISIPIPGERKLIVPIDATIKAYIDFSSFNSSNIDIQGEQLKITLPNPQIVLSSSKIDYKNEKQYLSWNRSRFTSEEIEKFTAQGRASILASMVNSDILDRSRISAYKTLLPILTAAGYKQENITISFTDEIEQNIHNKDILQKLILIENE